MLGMTTKRISASTAIVTTSSMSEKPRCRMLPACFDGSASGGRGQPAGRDHGVALELGRRAVAVLVDGVDVAHRLSPASGGGDRVALLRGVSRCRVRHTGVGEVLERRRKRVPGVGSR